VNATETNITPVRTDLFVTTALRDTPELEARGATLASELHAAFAPRRARSVAKLFAAYPLADRALLVQAERLILVDKAGNELFYHPNLAHLRMGNLTRGGRDFLIEAAQLQPGDMLLDCTLGFAGEAILCAHIAGDGGAVHGIEAVPELGMVVRDGLQTVTTDNETVNAAMRRVRVVHLGHHGEFLRNCDTGRYDVVYFDPFFPHQLHESVAMTPLRAFGDLTMLSQEAVNEARRVARRRVVIKADKMSGALEPFGVQERVGSPWSKVEYGVLPAINLPSH
jgi:hypothetical protein